MNYKVDHIPVSKTKRPGTKMTPTTITIHSTGNPNSTAKNERGWLINPSNGNSASWHICVDQQEAIEAIPLNEVAYHSGTQAGNYSSISIEICESGDRQETLQNAVTLVAKLLKERGWGVDRLRRHYDWNGKICPRIFYNDGNWTGWEQFKRDVQKELIGGNNVAQNKNQPSSWAKEAWEWAKKEGITDGTRPKDPATREEVIVMIKNALGVK